MLLSVAVPRTCGSGAGTSDHDEPVSRSTSTPFELPPTARQVPIPPKHCTPFSPPPLGVGGYRTGTAPASAGDAATTTPATTAVLHSTTRAQQAPTPRDREPITSAPSSSASASTRPSSTSSLYARSRSGDAQRRRETTAQHCPAAPRRPHHPASPSDPRPVSATERRTGRPHYSIAAPFSKLNDPSAVWMRHSSPGEIASYVSREPRFAVGDEAPPAPSQPADPAQAAATKGPTRTV